MNGEKENAKKLKRVLACMLAVVMVLGAVPVTDFAGIDLPEWFQLLTMKVSVENEEYYTYSVEDGEVTMKTHLEYTNKSAL